MDKKKEKLLSEAYKSYVNLILNDFPVERIDEIVAENLKGFGSTVDEKFLDINRFRRMILDQRKQEAGLDIKWTQKSVDCRISPEEDSSIYTDEFTLTMQIEGDKHVIPLRLSSIFEFDNHSWKVVHIHGSVGVETEENDTWHKEEWKQKQAELERQVEEKTAELVTKNRELEIEAALERVRSRTMAMQRSDELSEAAFLLAQQVRELGIKAWGCAFHIYAEDKEGDYEWFSNEQGYLPFYKTPRQRIFKQFYEKRKVGEPLFIKEFKGKACENHYNYLMSLPVVGKALQDMKKSGIALPTSQIDHVAYFNFGYLLFITYEPVPEAYDIFQRFAKAFEQTYTRFLDLQKAEAQTREAQIEAALEKVRSRSLAMHQSVELQKVVNTLFKEMNTLNIGMDHTALVTLIHDSKDYDVWVGSALSNFTDFSRIPFNTKTKIQRDYNKAIQSRPSLFNRTYSGKTKKEYSKYLFDDTGFKSNTPEQELKLMRDGNTLSTSIAMQEHTGIQIVSYTGKDFSDGENQILNRFALVFEQAYTRFLDLQKAEEQAREAQIEAALERIRARALAMHNSDELIEVASVLRVQMGLLDQPELETSSVHLYNDVSKKIESWFAFRDPRKKKGVIKNGTACIAFDSSAVSRKWAKMYYSDLEEYTVEIKGKDLRDWMNVRQRETPEASYKKEEIPGVLYSHFSKFSGGALVMVAQSEPSEESKSLQKRASGVFDLAYKRFIDLHKAEVQAREAQIEASLERMRSKSMAMQKADDLLEAGELLYSELSKLGISSMTSGYALMSDEGIVDWNYMVSPDDGSIYPEPLGVPRDETKIMRSMTRSWKKQEPYSIIELSPKETINHQTYIAENVVNFRYSAAELISFTPERLVLQTFNFRHGYVLMVGGERLDQEQIEIVVRFTKVFEQTYTRFLDLQKAEAQAREAQIEAALERIRSASMAMQKSEELPAVALTFLKQIENLAIPVLGVAINIIKIENDICVTYFADNTKGGRNRELFTSKEFKISDFWMAVETINRMKTGEKEFTIIGEGDQIDLWIDWVGESFSSERAKRLRAANLNKVYFHASEFHNYSGILFSSLKPLTEEYRSVIQRLVATFRLSYLRFLDLQQAETQAREAQIEAALERVRARSMAMHKSDELQEVINRLFLEIESLGVKMGSSYLVTELDEDITKGIHIWIQNNVNLYAERVHLPYLDHPMFHKFYKAWQDTTPFYTEIFNIKEKNRLFNHLFKHSQQLSAIPDERKKYVLDGSGFTRSVVCYKNVAFIIQKYDDIPFKEEEINIQKRFGSVFEQTYTRFLDLQKAEAQAREAQIEASLERVRAASMAMHQSEDLNKVLATMFKELESQGLDMLRLVIWIYNRQNHDVTWWAANPEAESGTDSFHIPWTDHEVYQLYWRNWENRERRHFYALKDDVKASWDEYVFNHTEMANLPMPVKKAMMDVNPVHLYNTFHDYGLLMLASGEELNDDVWVIERFSQVFNQSYTRFLDLKKAEEQAREAQIEAALERVRSQTMAMHNSEELADVIDVVFTELRKLGFQSKASDLCIIDKKTNHSHLWISGELDHETIYVQLGNLKNTHHKNSMNAWKSGEQIRRKELKGKVCHTYMQSMIDNVIAGQFPSHVKKFLVKIERVIHTDAFNRYGFFRVAGLEYLSEGEEDILIRFTKVFEQTYTRFLDLQKAEYQAREAQIEAALERVRNKAMAMQHSDDLAQSVSTTLAELEQLELQIQRCGVGIFNLEKQTVKLWTITNTEKEKRAIVLGEVSLMKHPLLKGSYQSWLNKKGFSYVLKGNELRSYYDMLAEEGFALPADAVEKALSIGRMYYSYFAFRDGGLYVTSGQTLSKKDGNIVQRFADVFHLAFTRYLDLQKAEVRAKEAIKQSSLDRVRAEIASMRKTKDLERITPLIWKELTTLGVPFFRCGIFIIKEEEQMVHAYLSTPAGEALAALHIGFGETELGMIGPSIDNWRKQEVYSEEWDQKRFIENMRLFMKRGDVKSSKKYQAGDKPPEKLVLHLVPFKQGMLYVGNSELLISEHIELMREVADAFSIAYSRYEDFVQLEQAKSHIEQTLGELKSTQTQLIHSEKMASLGELTAGIAHEIQNPLNFVNNFSEVSADLIEELKEELAEGNNEEVKEISQDLLQNMEKINHHGQRASSIVKGMLEHSRTGTQTKELTDLNALADEYLRLAYHGLRAKDKSFNANFKTELDTNLPKAKVFAQDIGRVLLNMINNAFYAVTSKAQQTKPDNYQPEVIISTSHNEKNIQIVIQDNGNGIPQKHVDKIFQPFFTTKPTGQGTGLGLSLSYDIVTQGHDGHLEVETEEGLGTRFIIDLPLTTGT